MALGDVRGPPGGLGVCRRGGREVAVELVQVTPDCVPPVPLAEHLAQPVGLAQPGGGAEDVNSGIEESGSGGGGVPAGTSDGGSLGRRV